ncbi:MAG: hypothetical protein P1U37_12690 [Minwuia sp.]|nr:hypothetical protein [Minwuia sp.]
MTRLVGENHELCAFRDETGLYIHVSVDVSFVSSGYRFDISENELQMLLEKPPRRLALNGLLHDMLAPRLVRDEKDRPTDNDCKAMIWRVLLGSDADVDCAISQSRSPGSVRFLLREAGFPDQFAPASPSS